MAGSKEVYVCKAGTCRAEGADAVMQEIEELATAVGGCAVRETGCLGNCSRSALAPPLLQLRLAASGSGSLAAVHSPC